MRKKNPQPVKRATAARKARLNKAMRRMAVKRDPNSPDVDCPTCNLPPDFKLPTEEELDAFILAKEQEDKNKKNGVSVKPNAADVKEPVSVTFKEESEDNEGLNNFFNEL
jgi:hypothetical protein